MTRVETLRARLLPPGTRMADVPPDHRGLTYAWWFELQCLEWMEEVQAIRDPAEEPQLSRQAITTARDGYGWRGLSTGSRMLDPRFSAREAS